MVKLVETLSLFRLESLRHPYLNVFNGNISLLNYCLTSRSGGEILMTELLLQPKIGFLFPKQLL